MLGHLFFEHFLQDGLHAFPDPGLHVALDVLIEPLVRGQVCLLNSTHNLPDTVSRLTWCSTSTPTLRLPWKTKQQTSEHSIILLGSFLSRSEIRSKPSLHL